jgi:hypothetical protein
MAFMFALGAFATWGSPMSLYGSKGSPALAYAFAAGLAGAGALLMDRRKSLVVASAILLAAVVLAVWAVLTGHGKLLGWLAFILPAAVTGLLGARALKRPDLPHWA